MKKIIFLITAVYAAVILTLSASAATCDNYEWGSVSLGGGGYVTGMAVHDDGTIYLRTDVSGIFKNKGAYWQPLTEWITKENKNLFGIDGIAVASENSQIVYAAMGKYNYSSPSGVYKTTDGGATWENTGLNASFGGNQSDRMKGECIAVDPNCNDIVYVLTNDNHMYLSKNAGESWEEVTSFPASSLGHHGRSIVFDKNSAVNGKSRVIYADIQGVGIYKSVDSGITWELMNGTNAPVNVYRMVVDKNGELVVAAENGLLKYCSNGWKIINNYTLYGETAFRAVDVDRDNPNRIIAVFACGIEKKEFQNVIFYTEDGGENWININASMTRECTVPWWLPYYFSAHTSDIHFRNGNEVWLTDWYGVWKTDDITKTNTVWRNDIKGIENMVAFNLACPTEGAPLIAGMADNSGMRIENIGTYPDDIMRNPLKAITCSIDFCEANPDIVARIATGTSDGGAIGISHDNGKTFTQKTPFEFSGGRIAVSCGGTDNISMVMVPVNGSPWYSTDCGETWKKSEFPEEDAVDFVQKIWSWNQCLQSDRVKPDTFYLCNAYNGKFYVSEDGGASWTMRKQNPSKYEMQIEAAPGMGGNIWMSLGNLGLAVSNDGGYSFSKIDNVQNSKQCSLGKGKDGSGYPAVYVYGTVNNEDGVFRSTDYGKTWDKISNDTTALGADVNCMKADRQKFGTVYIGTNGRSVYFGRENTLHTFFGEKKASNFFGHLQIKYSDNIYEGESDYVSVSGDYSLCLTGSKANLRYAGWDKDSEGNLKSIGDISTDIKTAIDNGNAYICGWFYASGGSKTKTVRLLYGNDGSVSQSSEIVKLPFGEWVYLCEKITDPDVEIGVIDTADEGSVYIDDLKIISVPIGENPKIPDREIYEGPGSKPIRYMKVLRELYTDNLVHTWTNATSSAMKDYTQQDDGNKANGKYALKFLGTLLMGYLNDDNQLCTLGTINEEITEAVKGGTAYWTAWIYVSDGVTTDGNSVDFYIPGGSRVRGEWIWVCRKLSESDLTRKNEYIKSNNLYTWIDDVKIVSFDKAEDKYPIEYYSVTDNGDEVVLNTTIFNNTLSDKPAYVIFADEDENGVLRNIEANGINLLPNRPLEILKTHTKPELKKGKVKVMIWDESYVPLTDAAVIFSD